MADEEQPEGLLPYFYKGFVADNVDPLGLGRVRVEIPGLIDEGTRWAWPSGTMGGGSTRRGFWSVPEIGALVDVFFEQGDVDHPHYFSGSWGDEVVGANAEDDDGDETSEGAEVPFRVRDVPKEDRHKVKVFETAKWVLCFDDRDGPTNEAGEPTGDADGEDSLLILHKPSGQFIEIDGANRGMIIEATTILKLKSQGLIDIEGLVVQIGGRKVVQNGKPIT